jgi:hypothetical protein
VLDLELPDTAPISVKLEAVQPKRLHPFDRIPEERLAGRIEVGEPGAIPLTLERVGDDQELRHFLEGDSKDYDFSLVHLSCTFDPPEDEPFTEAWLTVVLSHGHSSGGGADDPIAWSMKPLRLNRRINETRKVTLGGQLKLLEGLVGIEAQREVNKQEEVLKPFLQAFNLMNPDPYWRFRETGTIHIDGAYRLALVVRGPKGTAMRGVVAAEALVKRKHLGIVPYRALFEDRPQLAFQIA